jgi:hypothetical protein
MIVGVDQIASQLNRLSLALNQLNIPSWVQDANAHNTCTQRLLNDLQKPRLSRVHMIWLLPHPLPLLSCQQARPATHRKTEKERQLCSREGEERVGEEPNLKLQESLVLYKSFITLCLYIKVDSWKKSRKKLQIGSKNFNVYGFHVAVINGAGLYQKRENLVALNQVLIVHIPFVKHCKLIVLYICICTYVYDHLPIHTFICARWSKISW